ncbi:MAG: ABC transporter ATP-binding protein [Planctomycetota bacterium]|nr:ABC transporter ATP-binding protein [Planctomycetota bacterium]
MLVVRHLGKTFSTPTGPFAVLTDVSLEMGPRESVAILGPSGCGKSTLLQILGTLDEPTAGGMTLQGIDPFQLKSEALSLFRNRHIGFIFQDHYLLPQLSVWQNTLVPALATHSHVPESLVAEAHRLLDRVGLTDRLDHRPGELSGGQRQRVALARALLLKPTLVLADEPTGNLDAENGSLVSEMLLQLMAEESAILITVTHSEALAAKMDRQMQLVQGRLVT